MNQIHSIDPERRRLLAMAGGALGLLALAGTARAADGAVKYPDAAFETKNEDEALKGIFGDRKATPSDKVTLTAPDIAENGAVVPLTVESTLPKVTRIAFVVPDNPFPLAAEFLIPEGSEAYVSNRIKMGKTSSVVAIVESDGKLYSATKQVKVTVGGCGG